MEQIVKQHQKYEPGFKGPEAPEHSVNLQLEVIKNATLQDSGKFLSHTGTGRWLAEGVAWGKISEGEAKTQV